MKAIRKKPGCEPEIIEVENTLKALQQEVGGYIETVTIASDAVVICNEEGVLLGMPYNCRFVGVDFVGPILVVGRDRDEFCERRRVMTITDLLVNLDCILWLLLFFLVLHEELMRAIREEDNHDD